MSSFHTPEGFLEKCTWLDDNAEHQIRLLKKGHEVWVSCTCAVSPIAPSKDVDEAWAKYHEFHDELDNAA